MTARIENVTSPTEDDDTLVVKGWGDTRIKVCKFIYLWTIHNFMLWFEGTSEMLTSPSFPVGANHGLRWNLRFQSRGGTEESTLRFPITLTLDQTSNKSRVQAKYKFSLLSADNNKLQIKEGFRRITKGVYTGADCCISRSTLIDERNRFLPNDKLTIYCEIITLADHLKDFSIIPECNLSVDLGVALANRELSDVTLFVNGFGFRAHKVILSARSPVFRSMFKQEVPENQIDKVEITDMIAEVLEEFLEYIYTGQVCAPEMSLAIGLLIAADKYQIKRLKMICEKQLSNTLTADRVTEIYILANQHNATLLKTRARAYIITHAKDVIITNEWKALVRTHPALYEEVFCDLVAQQVPSISALFYKN